LNKCKNLVAQIAQRTQKAAIMKCNVIWMLLRICYKACIMKNNLKEDTGDQEAEARLTNNVKENTVK